MSPSSTNVGGFPVWLQHRLPFFYGWVVLTAVCCAGFARQGPAVATLSIFIEPMTGEFGWSRTSLSAAVSLGGVLAAIASPLLGPILDRRGARVMLCVAVLVTGMCALLLSLTQSLIVFILLFCIARMSFASPFELGIYGAVNNWFVRKRGIATSMATFMQMMGLMAMPLIAQLTINTHGWRSGWIAIGITVLIVGFIPVWLLVVRRPEDMGIVPDGTDQTGKEIAQDSQGSPSEPAFTRAQAVRTGTFWLLSLYTLLVYPVQAGVSLHQVPHLIERGIDPTIAATIIGVFSLLSAISGLAFGAFIRHLGVRWSLMVTALFLALSAVVMVWITQSWHGYVAAALFGMGIGGMLTVLPLAWADYFGRASYGAIRGTALVVQVVAQAAGPLISGILRDYTGDYVWSLWVFVVFSVVAILTAVLIRVPPPPAR